MSELPQYPKYASEHVHRRGLRAAAAARFPKVPQWPSHRRRHNQKVLSDRCGWPKGALLACWRLQHRYPGWDVSWSNENTIRGFERPAGFYADYDDAAGGGRHKIKGVFAKTEEELEPLLVEVPEHDYSMRGCAWCLSRL